VDYASVKACPHWRQKSPKTETKSIRFRRQMDTNGYFLYPFSATFVAVFGDELRILFVSVFGDFCRQCGQALKPSGKIGSSKLMTTCTVDYSGDVG